MPKSKNKRKSGGGRKGTTWNKKVAKSVESDKQRLINAEREFMRSVGK